MITLLSRNVFDALTNLTNLADKLASHRHEMSAGDRWPADEYVGYIMNALSPLKELAETLKLPATLAAEGRCREVLFVRLPPDLQLGPNDVNALAHVCGQLAQSCKDELGARPVFSLSATDAELIQAKGPLFGEAVERAFIDASYDIDEAAKCLALERSTAAVFHLMRAVETAAKEIGVTLGATVHTAYGEPLAWGVILANIKPKIDALPKGPGQDEWYKVHAMLHAVNRAFHTKTAHPAEKYTQEEAENAFAATKAFLQEMAERVL